MRAGILLTALLLALAGSLGGRIASAAAETSPSPVTAPPVTGPASLPSIEELKAKIAALEGAPSPNEPEHTQMLELYRQALSALQETDKYAAGAEQYKQAIESAPAEMAQIRQALNARATSEQGPTAPASSSNLDSRLAADQAQLTALQNQAADLDDQIAAQQARPDNARAELADAKQKLANIEQALQQAGSGAETAPIVEARRTALLAQQAAYSARIDMLEQELLSHDARLALLRARRDALEQQIADTEARIKRLQDLANQKRFSEAAQAAKQTEQTTLQAVGQPAPVREAAAANAALSQRLSDLADQIQQAGAEQTALERRLKNIDDSYQRAKQQLQIAGLSNALGPVLRGERRRLPDVSQYRLSAKQRQQRITQARLDQFRIDEQYRNISDIDATLDQLMADKVDPQLPAAQRQAIAGKLRRLLTDRLQLLEKLSGSYVSYITQLVELDRKQKQLVEVAGQYATLLDENLLWIASGAAVGKAWLGDLQTAVDWLASPAQWADVAVQWRREMLATPLLTAAVLLVFAILLALRRRLRLRLETMHGQVGNVSKDSFLLTLEALLILLLHVLPWPLLFGFAGWLLMAPGNEKEFASAVGFGLYNSALLFFIIEAFRRLCRDGGIAQVHFRWNEQSRSVLKNNLLWLLVAELPPSFLVSMTEYHSESLYRDTLGRLAFVAGSVALSVFVARVFRPQHGALVEILERHRNGWWWRLRYLWYPFIVGTPLVLAGMALQGYYYTALQLESRVFTSGWLLVGAVIAVNLVVRWFNVAERRLALIRARAKREAAQAARATREAAQAAAEAIPENLDIPEIDLATIGEQARALLALLTSIGLAAGLWLIWHDLLPALNILNNVTLWHQTITVGGAAQIREITLGGFILAVLLAALTLIVARNLPGALAIIVLQRFHLQPGDRYAITTIGRYAILTTGFFIALNILGVSWEQAQWLVAALGVGLGFGLQEIFANFVSGLIILFERPIRVGDTITVGDFSGTVSRIRMRATTITDWDHKELIIPNKSFITGPLINWTLSDPITRLIITVGVAYGSDPALVQRVMLKVVEANPLVLKEPAPAVFFLQFGDSALNFEIRLFVRELADRIPLTHELHMGIERALREHNIEIPFPQRDLHVRSIDPSLQQAMLRRERT